MGWNELGDMGRATTKEELRALIAQAYPGGGKARIANWTGQLWRFRAVIEVGDHVVMPVKSRGTVAIGRVTGPYEYRADAPEGFRHVRPVQWLRTDIPRDAIKQDLLDSMGSLLTVCGLHRADADVRVAHLAEHGTDPGPLRDDDADAFESSSRSELLAKAAERDPARPVQITIRAFLSLWDAVRRTQDTVERIEADLADKGLTTRPPFTEGWIGSTIQLVPLGEEPAAGQADTGAQAAEDTRDVADLPPLTLRIGDLEAAGRGVMSVAPGQPLQNVVTTMVALGYSQLAVIAEDGTFHGAVSWESIGRARMSDPDPGLDQATVSVPLVDQDEPLLDQIEQIYARGFVFVRSADKRSVSGIVSTADLTRQFGELARPFVLIEEAERRLRRRVDERIPLAEIRKRAPRWSRDDAQSAAVLTLGNYRSLLDDDENWKLLDWNVDRRLFFDLLNSVKAIRNETMHFSPDPLTAEQLGHLTGFLALLRTLDPTS
ncbi:CBS domain protein [Actinomadura rubteroloni]|uniref:CBS domain protein n=1 Tax=Actinomadura rubteroloni TaxID=1926885 RepID=A0A2P4URG1_9ACTN|nr:CBS domain-containing protein [Actinomadura rubteroloni]POM27639.1 CBS domain protein [Actinomadura rubteroloni]